MANKTRPSHKLFLQANEQIFKMQNAGTCLNAFQDTFWNRNCKGGNMILYIFGVELSQPGYEGEPHSKWRRNGDEERGILFFSPPFLMRRSPILPLFFLHPFASAFAAILRRRTRPADRNGESFPSNEPRLRPAGAGVG